MAFTLASSITENTPFKASMYGPQGSGKTFTALLFAEVLVKRRGGRIAVIDTENGSRFYSRRTPRRVHPEPFDFDVLRTTSLADMKRELDSIDPSVHTCVIIDSMSHLWDAAKEAWESSNPGKDPSIKDWGPIKRPYKRIMTWTRKSRCDVILCGRQKAVFDSDDAGKLRNAGVAMRAEGETQYEPDFNFRMEQEGKRGEDCDYSMFVEKDRTGVLAGKWYRNPTGDVLLPVFPFLGSDAPPVEDEDDRAEKDAELADEDADKAKNKEEKSAGIFSAFSARISTATATTELDAIATELKKAKRSMIAEHMDSLRMQWNLRYESLKPKIG